MDVFSFPVGSVLLARGVRAVAVTTKKANTTTR